MEVTGFILAMITTQKEKVGGGAPIFFAENLEEMQAIAFNLEKIMDASAHEVSETVFIMVKH